MKDNIDTADLPTTGGSVLLEGSIPPDDAFVIKKLRAAGAVIIAKANLSEFASAATKSSIGGQILNPHDLTRSPAGSSGGTGVALAAAFAMAGLGTDTGGSVRGPSTNNGIAGLKTTMGLVSRDGVIPLALSLDMVGPMARHVSDVAALLNVLTGVDAADASTKVGAGRAAADYTLSFRTDALKGARFGIARDFMGQDQDVDWVMEAAIDTMKKQGATVIDVRLPRWLLDGKGEYYTAVRYPEFVAQIADYLATIGPSYPKNLDQLIERARRVNAPRPDGAGPNPARWSLMLRESASGTLNDYQYTSVRDHALPLVRDVLSGVLTANKLDAIVYTTDPRRPQSNAAPAAVPGGAGNSPSNLANLSGFPDLIVPRVSAPMTCRSASRSLAPHSANHDCSRSATASNRRRRFAACPCTRRYGRANQSPFRSSVFLVSAFDGHLGDAGFAEVAHAGGEHGFHARLLGSLNVALYSEKLIGLSWHFITSLVSGAPATRRGSL